MLRRSRCTLIFLLKDYKRIWCPDSFAPPAIQNCKRISHAAQLLLHLANDTARTQTHNYLCQECGGYRQGYGRIEIHSFLLKSPDGPAHAGCAPGGTYGSSTTNRKSRSPSRPKWLRRRQPRRSRMDAVRGPFARNTTPNSAPYTTESCFVSSGHSARDQTIG